jgi:cellulose synthase/poly-beta-1,6-N-acetylglucosamine synthase-like glycosyltransferase
MIFVFYFFALLLLWQGTLSLIGGIRFARYIEKELRRQANHFTPYASVIVPCRGIDDDLRDNLRRLWRQDYPSYELIFIFDSAEDEAARVIEELRCEGEDSESNVARVRIFIAGRATDSGQKVHNLRAGVKEVDEGSEVFAFLDTDARPGDGWLRALVSPLADEAIGATTGYRWFVPMQNRFPSLLRAVWNASITSTLGADGKRNFCWGGSTAIRPRDV